MCATTGLYGETDGRVCVPGLRTVDQRACNNLIKRLLGPR